MSVSKVSYEQAGAVKRSRSVKGDKRVCESTMQCFKKPRSDPLSTECLGGGQKLCQNTPNHCHHHTNP